MVHFFLDGRLRRDPVLREYLDSMERGPVIQVITATSVYSVSVVVVLS
jgi:hypothetical protein